MNENKEMRESASELARMVCGNGFVMGILTIVLFAAALPVLVAALAGVYVWVEVSEAPNGIRQGFAELKANLKRGEWF